MTLLPIAPSVTALRPQEGGMPLGQNHRVVDGRECFLVSCVWKLRTVPMVVEVRSIKRS